MEVYDEKEARLVEKPLYVEAAAGVLARKQSLDAETDRTDREQRAIVEREFLTTIQACINGAGLLIATSDEAMPETNAERFEILHELGVLSGETVERMRSAAGFRNVLAHEY